MSSIDNRIVNMQFNQGKFKQGAQEVLSILDRLKKSLKLDGAAKGIDEVNKTASRFSLKGMAEQLSNIGAKFSVFGAIAFTAIQRVVNAAIDAGKKIAGAVLDPIIEGGKKRALNIEQARFQFQGLGMDINASMASASEAVDGTAFALDEAAVVAAQFGASGMKAGDEMTKALKGISGVAAMSGSSFSDVGNIFTKVAGQGRLMGDDLLSLSSRGINAAATLAKAWGKSEADVRKMVTEGKVNFKDFAAAMSDAFGEQAKKANDTFSGAMSNMRSALARIGQLWFYGVDINQKGNGVFERQRVLFLALTKVINQVKNALVPLFYTLNNIANIGNASRANWLESLDLTNLARFMWIIAGAVEAFYDAVQSYLKPIGEAFQQVFARIKPPAGTEPWFLHMAWAIRTFAQSLKLSGDGQERVRGIFVKLFTVLKAGGSIIKGVFKWFLDGVKIIFDLAGALGSIIGPIIEFFTGFQRAEKPVTDLSTKIDSFFDTLIRLRRAAIDPIIGLLRNFGAALDEVLNGDPTAFGKRFEGAFGPLKKLGEGFRQVWTSAVDWLGNTFGPVIAQIKSTWDSFVDGVINIGGLLSGVWRALGSFFKGAGDGLSSMFEGLSWQKVFAGINAGVLLAVGKRILDIAKGFGGIADLKNDVSGFIQGVTSSFEGLTGVFKAMQQDIKAGALLKLAGAIAVLAGAFMLLSFLPQDKILSSSIAMGIIVGSMVVAMRAMDSLTSSKTVAKMPVLAASLILFAGAIGTVAIAMLIFSKLSWEELAIGALGAVAAIGMLVGAAFLLSNIPSGKLILAAMAMQIMSVALAMMAGVVTLFSLIPMDALVQGMVAAGIALGGLAIAGMLIGQAGPGMLLGSIGLIAMSFALSMLVPTILALGYLPYDVLVQGMTALGIALGGMAIAGMALGLVGPAMLMGSLGLIAMAIALNMMVPPILALGMMDMPTLVQGLIGLAAALAVLVIAAIAMSGAVVGAAGMLAMAAGILVLSVALSVIAGLGMAGIAVAIIGLAAAFAVLLIGGLALAAVSPVLLTVGAAMMLFGVGIMAMSVAMLIGAVAMMVLTPALMMLTPALVAFGERAGELALAAGVLALLAVAIAAFGAAALIAGVGVLLLGTSLIILGTGLTMIAAIGMLGAVALAEVAKTIGGLLKHAPGMAIMAGTFALVGAAVLVLGAGLLVLGAGAIVAGAGLLLITAGGAAVSAIMDRIVASFAKFIPLTGNIISLGSGLAMFGMNLASIANAGKSASGAIQSLARNLQLLANALRLTANVSTSTSAIIRTTLTMIVTSVRNTGSQLLGANQTIVRAFLMLATGIVGTSPIIIAQTMIVMTGMVKAVDTGRGQLQTGLTLVVTTFALLPAGILTFVGPATAAANTLVNGLRSALITGLTGIAGSAGDAARTIGNAIINGMVRGLQNGSPLVTAAARNVATRALAASKQALGVASPSKEFEEIGYFSDLGLAKGLLGYAVLVSQAAKKVGNEAIDGLKQSMSNSNRLIDTGLDTSITIRPIMDLSDVERGLSNLDGILGGRQLDVRGTADIAARSVVTIPQAPVDVSNSPGGNSGGVIQFQQNNYSPKALSKTEIYRQTNNQLRAAKGVIG